MARGRKVETGVKRDNKGRILPKGISQRKDGRYIWRYTYEGVSYKPVYSWDLKALKQYADEEKLKIIKIKLLVNLDYLFRSSYMSV